MDAEQKFIQEYFDGDKKRYDQAQTHVAENPDIYAMSWEDIHAGATILVDLEDDALNLIERGLGYLPHASSRLPFEPYLRGLIQSHRQGTLSKEEFAFQAEEHIKLIRNEDLKFNLGLSYDQSIYENYHKNYHLYGAAVRGRLVRFLGYEPQLEHSLIAEMWFRDIIAKDNLLLPGSMTGIDIKAMTEIRYRQILLTQGKQAADASPLLGTV